MINSASRTSSYSSVSLPNSSTTLIVVVFRNSESRICEIGKGFGELEKFPRKRGKERKILEGSRKRLQRERERERERDTEKRKR